MKTESPPASAQSPQREPAARPRGRAAARRESALLAIEALEPRILLSADAAPLQVAGDGGEPVAAWVAFEPITSAGDAALTAATGAVQPGAMPRRELIVVDADVPDAAALVDALTADSPARFEIVLLDAQRDALTQVGEAIAAGGPVDAVHLLSHGEPGALVLGGERIDAATLAARAVELRAWSASLTADADLLLYGCDLAATAEGRAVVDRLAELTGADVAASTDATGSAPLGGDWDLELTHGRIDVASLAIDASIASAEKSAWANLLGTISVDTTADVVDGDTSSVAALLASRGADGQISLREAVLAANNSQGADTILLASAKYNLDGLPGTNEDAALTGDLDIVGELTIRGVQGGSTEINGKNADRIFDVHAGATLVIEDMKLKDGKVDAASGTDGGEVLVRAGGRLVATGVTFERGEASGDGGAVAIAGGSAAIFDSEFENNKAGGSGAAIANLGGQLEVQRSAFHRGDAGARGGGVYDTGSGTNATLTLTTFFDNQSGGGGGAVAVDAGATVSISQSTFDSNDAPGSTGGAFNIAAGGTIRLRMSIVDHNTSTASNRPVVSDDYNIDRDETLGLNRAHDREDTDPKLGSFGDHGGPTRTIDLQSGSPAIDAGTTSGSALTDQRGVERTYHFVLIFPVVDPDIGAYEYDSSPSTDLAARADAGGAYAIVEGAALALDASGTTDPDSGSSALRFTWDLNGDGSFDDATGRTPTLSWAQLQALGLGDDGHHTIRLRVESTVLGTPLGNPVEAVGSLDIANTRPTLAVSGAGSVSEGSAYSLALSASDPGADTISQWIVNWGDGHVDHLAGSQATVASHTYANGGATRDITVAAVDEDGTWFDSTLYAGLQGLDRVEQFAPVSGASLGAVGGTQPGDPLSMRFGPDGRLYVADRLGSQILVRNSGTGQFETFVAAGAGGLSQPLGPAFGPDGSLYVASRDLSGDDALLRFDGTTGAYLGVALAAGDHGAGELAAPVFGPDGLLYVGDRTNGVIRRYDVAALPGTAVYVDDFVTTHLAGLASLDWGIGGDLFASRSTALGSIENVVERFNGATGAWHSTFVGAVAGLGATGDIRFGPDGKLYVASSGDDTIRRFDGLTGASLGSYVPDGWVGAAQPMALAFVPQLQVQVLSANNAPVLFSIESATLAYTEGAGASSVTSTIRVVDGDSAALLGAQVAISTGYVNGEDVLALPDAAARAGLGLPPLTVTWSGASGTLTVTGSATPAQYETLLRLVTYENSSATPTAGSRAIRFTVTDDGSLDSNAQFRFVSVTAVNNPPVLATIEGSALAWTEGDPPAAVTQTLTLSDGDSTTLASATIRISAGYTQGEDELVFTDTASIYGSWNPASGTLTLTGADSLANWRDALRAVQYRNLSDNPPAVSREVEFSVSDGAASSAPAVRAIALTPVNDPPVLAGLESGALAYAEGDGALALSATVTASDPDSATLASATLAISSGHVPGEDVLALSGATPPGMTVSWDPGAGTLTLAGAATPAEYTTLLRNVTYANLGGDPAAGPRVVTLTLSDGALTSVPVSRQVDVTPVNDPPVLSALEPAPLVTTEGDPPVALSASLAVADVDDTTVARAVVAFASGYRNGDDVLQFTDTATITGSWDANNGILTLAGTDTLAAYEAALRSVRYENLSQDPAASRTVSFVVEDGAAPSVAVMREITVTPVNQAPVLALPAGTLAWTEGDAPELLAAGASIDDVDSTDWDGGTLQVAVAAGAGPGDRLAIRSEGSGPGQVDVAGSTVRYGGAAIGTFTGGTGGAPLVVSFAAGATRDGVTAVLWRIAFDSTSQAPGSADRSVVFSASDGDGGTSAPVARIVRVTEVNAAPTIAAPTSASTPEDTTLVFSAGGALPVAVDDNDAGTDTLEVRLQATHGTIALARLDGLVMLTGSGTGGDSTLSFRGTMAAVNAALDGLAYTPSADYAGPAEIRARVTEPASSRPATNATIALAVQAVNDPPVLVANATLPASEGASVTVTSQTLAIADVDDAVGQRYVTLLAAPAHGRLTVGGVLIGAGDRFSQADIDAGRVQYTPAGDGSRAEAFAFRVTDAAGASAGDFTFNVAIIVADGSASSIPSSGGASSSSATGSSTTTTGASTAAGSTAAGTSGSVSLDTALLAGATDPNSAERRRQTPVADENLLGGLGAAARPVADANAGSARSAGSERTSGGAGSGDAGAKAGAGSGGTASLLLLQADSPDLAAGTRSGGFLAGATAGDSRSTSTFTVAVSSTDWRRELDRVRDDVAKDATFLGALGGGSAAVVGSLSVGYVFWLLRGGMLLTSLLTAMPAWYAFDPMPVLARRGERLDDDGDDAVEQMFGRARPVPPPEPAPPPPAAHEARGSATTES